MFSLARRIRSKLVKLQAVRRPESRRRLADQFLRLDPGPLTAGPVGTTWFHNLPLPDGRQIHGAPGDPAREAKLWDACFDDDRDCLVGKRVLDVGANDGFFTVAALLCGARSVHAVNPGELVTANYPANLRFAARVWGVRPTVTVGDFLDLPVDGPKYDVILFFGVFYHLENVVAGMRHLAALLAPGGRVYLETQMTRVVAANIPVMELASDRFPSTVPQYAETLDRRGNANFFLPNEAGLTALADTFGLDARPLSPDTPYERSLGGHGKRKVFVLTRRSERPLPKKG
jgi:SAM-dependent methyltransferase